MTGRTRAAAIAASALPLLFLVGWGLVGYATADEHAREWSGRLSAMADDRAAAIQRWADDLHAAASTFASYPTVLSTLGGPRRTPIQFPDERARRRHLQDILASAARQHRLAGIWVLDPRGELVAASGAGDPGEAVVHAGSRAARTGIGSVQVLRPGAGDARVLVTAPVRAAPGTEPLGVVVIETLAGDFLYDFLAGEPVPTETGEALLVSLEDPVRFLSPLRKTAASGDAAPAAARAFVADFHADGQDGLHQARDYAGDEVLAVTRRVEGVPWALVVKVDRREAMAERRADRLSLALTLAGLLLGGFGIAYGLSKRNAAVAQRRLREHDDRFHWHAERAGDLIYRYRVRPEPGVEYVNPAAEQLLGYGHDAHVADPELVWRIIHPEDRPTLEAAVADPAAWDGEPLLLRWVRADGGIVWLEQRNTVVRDETGAVVAIEGIAREVTARKALERDLTEARDRLQLALHVARQTLFEIDVPAGRLLVSTSRPSPDGLVQPDNRVLSMEDGLLLVHPEDRERMRATLRDLASGRADSSDAEFRVRGADGATRWVRTVSRVVARNERGQALRILGLHADITERRLVEAGLRESEERYSALEEEMLHAQKMEAVGRLAGGIAHDFNNVLTSIRGHALIALEDLPAGWPAREDVEEVIRDADRAAALTRQLLSFSRKQVMEMRVFDLGEVVVGMERMIRRLIGEDIHLVVERLDCPCAIHADPARLEQVLLNLVVNARDAMPGGGRLTITVDGGGDSERPEVHFRVRDTGMGMDPRTIERIFEPFFTTKDPGKGTGLGLSTAYGIIRQCGGDIRVDSAVGLGTTFTMVFPRIPAAEAQPSGPEPSARHEGTPAPNGAPVPSGPAAMGARILVVEDEAAVRDLTRRILEKRGFDVTTAACPEEALAATGNGQPPYRVLLSDVVLPGIGGPGLVARLGDGDPDLRVIFMSGYPEAVVRGQHEIPEGALFLEKPFAPDQLLRRLDEALAERPGAAA